MKAIGKRDEAMSKMFQITPILLKYF